MIKYKDIVYSKKAPKEHNVLWIKAGKYNPINTTDPETQDQGEYPGSRMYQFVDGYWRSVNNYTDTENDIALIKEDLNNHENEIDNLKQDTTTSINAVDEKITALQDSVTRYKGIEQQLAMPVVYVEGLHNISMDTQSITVNTSIHPTPATAINSKSEAIGNAIYYKHVPYIILTNSLTGANNEVGIPCKLFLGAANFALKTNYSVEMKPTYITETAINVNSGNAEVAMKKIKVEFDSMNEIEANTSQNHIKVSLID